MIQFERLDRAAGPGACCATLALAALFSMNASAQSSWQELTVYSSTGGGGWAPTAKNSALGFYGTQAMVQFGPFIDRTRLLSTFDTPVATPVWSRSDPVETQQHRVAAAEFEPVFATLHNRSTDDPIGLRDVYFRVYGPTSSQPVYETLLPFRTSGQESLFVGTPRDGSFVLAAVYDILADQAGLPNTFLLRYDTATGMVMRSGVRVPFGGFRFADLAADGRRALLITTLQAVVVDTATLTEVFSMPLGGSFQVAGGKLAGDAKSFVLHGSQAGTGNLQGSLSIYVEGPGGAYSFDQELLDPSFSRCSSVALSQSGLNMAFGMDDPGLTGVTLSGLTIDPVTRALTTSFSWSQPASSSFQMYSTSAEMSPDGDHAVFGLSGDGAGPDAELVFFDTQSSQPEAMIGLPGSVFSVDLANGFVLVSSKRGHLNEILGGGDFRIFSRARNLNFSGGKPRPSVDLDVRATEVPTSNFSRVIYSAVPGLPSVIGNLGTLYIDRDTFLALPIGFENGQGEAQGTFRCAPNVGDIRYCQGLHAGIFRRLTDDWLPVMTLP